MQNIVINMGFALMVFLRVCGQLQFQSGCAKVNKHKVVAKLGTCWLSWRPEVVDRVSLPKNHLILVHVLSSEM